MNTRQLAKIFPEAFQWLPAPYRNDDCLFFWANERGIFACPAEGQWEILGQWVCQFDPNFQEWKFIAGGQKARDFRDSILIGEE